MRRSVKQFSLVAFLTLGAVLSAVSIVDQQAAARYEGMFQRALVTFALARTLNGVISAVQGTELALQPAGVGLTLTPGEILDPVNDLVERFSWIMLAATVSLGVQQVLLDISGSLAVKVMASIACLVVLFLVLRGRARAGPVPSVFLRLLIVVLFIRLAVPVMIFANDFLYEVVLDARYQESAHAIATAGAELKEAQEQESSDLAQPPETSDSFFGSIERVMDSAAQSIDIRSRLENMKQQAGQIVQHLIQMSVIFIFQTALLPLLFLWALLQGARWAFRLKPVRSHPDR